jgi:hypothetical protein
MPHLHRTACVAVQVLLPNHLQQSKMVAPIIGAKGYCNWKGLLAVQEDYPRR